MSMGVNALVLSNKRGSCDMRIWNARGQDLDSESASLLGKGMGYDGDMSAYYGVPVWNSVCSRV